MKRLPIAFVVLFLAFIGYGCGKAVRTEPDIPIRPPDISGHITSIDAVGTTDGGVETLGHVLVVGEGPAGALEALVKVTPDTSIVRRVGDSITTGGFEDLKVDALVEVRFTGPVAESYPIQATASEITIRD